MERKYAGMRTTYENKWVRQIVNLQHPDGSWGYFHTLSKPTKERPMTTEQALRRLRILGITKDDEPIQRALTYMRSCLTGERHPPDGREKVLNWGAFEAHMLSTWIKLFDPEDTLAATIARFWADIISDSFPDGTWDARRYGEIYRKHIPSLHRSERMIALSQFYMVHLLQGELDEKTEAAFVKHIIKHEAGIYYVYGERIADAPTEFASRQASQYIAALECLAGYRCAKDQLQFAVRWIQDHRNEDGLWDMGPQANDGICFPLSDSWRKPGDRAKDCTARIERLLAQLQKPQAHKSIRHEDRG